MEIPLDEVVHFDVVTSDPETASVSDADSTPTFSVYEEETDTAIVGPTSFTKRTSLTGNYRGTFTASAANGFDVGKWYSVIASATVNEFEGKCAALRFRIVAAEVTAGQQVVTMGSGGIASVSFAAGAIDAAAIATDAFGALELAAGAASEIATAVRSELGTELGRIDVATSTRQPTIWANAASVVDLSGTTVGLTAAAIASIWAALTSALTTFGSIGKFIVDNLAAAIGGTGARTVTITVDDGTDPLENAIVRLSQGGESYIADTDASGVVTFNVDDATWTVAITKVGYSFAGTTLVVNGTESATYSMDSTSISIPANPDFCTLAIRVWGTDGAVAEGIDVKAQIIEAPTGTGEMFNDSIVTDSTGADGYAQFTVPKSCGVKYWIGTSEKKIDDVGTDDVVYVDNHLGHE